ncbi:hypothetical protein [Hydrogenophaga sp. SL48]|uniref:hypothetical protein n=1 Tax=Hydrogenophaga sp. SL48 TaxID=2806347 RepID=UPI001F188F28|nr:hypothetical protein [Hydrogenophaga sp. SL48]UJW81196.1 hypothetical protein IM738_00125 [Hydrogenophaga sp. SL48]
MTNSRRTDLERLRSIVWAAGVAEAMQIKNFLELELELQSRLGKKVVDPSGIFLKYSKGAVMPSKNRGLNCEGKWIDGAEAVVPGSSAWFKTPLWFLLKERGFSPEELLSSAELLPQEIASRLRHEHSGTAATRLRRMRETVIVDMLGTSTCWSLGGLVCVARIAQLQAHPYCARDALIASTWLLQRHAEQLPLNSLLVPPLQELSRVLAARAMEAMSIDGHVATPKDVGRHLDGWSQRLEFWQQARLCEHE